MDILRKILTDWLTFDLPAPRKCRQLAMERDCLAGRQTPPSLESTTKINILGGAISIFVPYGANDGIVEVSVRNGVEAFLSLKYNMNPRKAGHWLWDKTCYISGYLSVAFVIALSVIDISNVNEWTKPMFGAEKFEIGKFIYGASVLFAFALFGVISYF